MHFGYIRLFFTSSIIGGGMFIAYFIYIKNGVFLYSVLYGIITALIIFFLVGFFIVNVYGS